MVAKRFKTSTVRVNGNMIFKGHKLTIGLDLGDHWSCYCVLDEAGKSFWNRKRPRHRKVKEIESLNERIQEYEVRVEKIAKESYPHVELLKQVKGVGTQIALTYVLTLDDPHRFPKSREVGCFLGLCPGRRDSGESQPQMRISKEGDRYLRTMLVQGAHYILGPFGADSDLRRWGLKLATRGGKNAKKRAVVAVARKLAVLLHRLWVSGEVYEPLRNSQKVVRVAA